MAQHPDCREAIWNAFHACERRDGRLLTDADIANDVPCWLETSRQVAHLAHARADDLFGPDLRVRPTRTVHIAGGLL